MDSPDGTLPGYGEQPLRSIALCYVYYSVLRLLFLFARAQTAIVLGQKSGRKHPEAIDIAV